MQGDLFTSIESNKDANLCLPPCVKIWRDFISINDANNYLCELLSSTPWQQPHVTVYGKSHPIPRMQHWMGDKHTDYTYSGKAMISQPWLPLIAKIKQRVELTTGYKYNSCLANYYRNGEDTMGWHSDDEPELGNNPVVACVSFGAVRPLMIRHKQSQQKYSVDMPHGSLMLMKPGMQASYQHHIPVRKKITEPRISLTFRTIVPV